VETKKLGPLGARQVGIFEAKTHFSALVDDAAAGKATVITKRGKPVAQIVPMDEAKRERARLAGERIRAMRGVLKLAPGEDVRDLIHDLINEGRR
jgi:prevent-host-death family protein